MWRPVLNIFSAVAGDEQEQQQYRGGDRMGDAHRKRYRELRFGVLMRNLDRYTIVFIYIKSLFYVCPTVDLFIIDHHHHQRHPLNRPSTAAAFLLHSSRNKWKPNIKSGKLYFCVFDGIGTTININIFATSHCVMDRETAVTIKLGGMLQNNLWAEESWKSIHCTGY